MKRKILCLLMTIVVILAFSAFAACSDNTDPPVDPPDPTPEITIEMTSTLTVDLFKTGSLSATTNSEENVVYTSLDTTVLTIDSASGVITPLKAGTATVTAKVEDKTASCTVTVQPPDADDLSVVALNVTMNIKTTKTATVAAQAYLVEDELDGASFTFVSDNHSIASVDENGVVTGVGKGTATITVTGTFKGVALGSDTVTVNVTEDVTVTATVASGTIYTSAGSDESNPLSTQTTLNVEVKLNDEAVVSPILTVTSSDEAIVKYVGDKLIAQGKKGKATVTVSYTSELDTIGATTVEVTVLYPTVTVTVDEPIVAGINRDSIAYTPDFTAVSAAKALINGEEYPVSIDKSGDIITGINGVTASESEIEVKIIVDSSNTTYEINLAVTMYDFLIGNSEEFVAFANALTTTNYVYALLTDNIDMENNTIDTANNPADCSGDENTTSFSLDGNGYSVLNLSASNKRGAFAAKVGKNTTGKDSVIKNIAFANFDAMAAGAGGLFLTVENVAFENFYLSARANFNWGATVALWSRENVTYNNAVVYCYDVADKNRTQTGFGRPVGALTSEGQFNTEKNYTNTYAINAYATKMIRGNGSIVDDEEVEDEPLKFTEGLYASWAAFKAVVTTLPTGFDATMWKINENGELIFKSIPEPEIPVFEYLPEITGEENTKLFRAISKENSVIWSEADNAYHFVNTLGPVGENERGFYLDFDYIAGMRAKGAIKISFSIKANPVDLTINDPYQAFVSLTTNSAGDGWWDYFAANESSLWRNLENWSSFEFTLASISDGSSLFFLLANPGYFMIKDIQIDYPIEFEYLPTITGEENAKLFRAISKENSVIWSEADNAYHFTNTVTAENDTRGFYLDFDYIAGMRAKGAIKISFSIKANPVDLTINDPYQAFVSLTTNSAGDGWWDYFAANESSLWRNLENWSSFEFTLASISDGSSLFFLLANPGYFMIKDIQIDYPATI